MYEIEGVKITREQLEAEAKRRGITFEALLEANKGKIVELREDGTRILEAEIVPLVEEDKPDVSRPLTIEEQNRFADSIMNPAKYDPANQNVQTVMGQPVISGEFKTQDIVGPDDVSLSAEERTALSEQNYDSKVESYNQKIKSIMEMPGVSQEEKIKLVNEQPMPEFNMQNTYPSVPGFVEDESVPSLDAFIPESDEAKGDINRNNEYLMSNKRNEVNEVIGPVGNSEDFRKEDGIKTNEELDKKATEAFVSLRQNDPIIKSRLEAYKKMYLPNVEAYMNDLIEKDVYDTTTQTGINAFQEALGIYYANLIEQAMLKDNAVTSQSEKIAELVEQEIANKQVALGRSQSDFYSAIDKLQSYIKPFDIGTPTMLNPARFLSGTLDFAESLAVNTADLLYDAPNTIGAQVDGMQIKANKEMLEKLEKLRSEGKSDDDEVVIKIQNPLGPSYPQIEKRGTIFSLEQDAKVNIGQGSESLVENIEQIEDFKGFSELQKKAKFTDGISFSDLSVALGQSLPTMAAVSAGVGASMVPGLGPVAVGMVGAMGQVAATGYFYADEYINGVRQGILDNPDKYPGGDTKENMLKAIESGEFDDVAQDIAMASTMSLLERVGAGSQIKAAQAIFKQAKITGGLNKMYYDGVKHYLNKVKNNAVLLNKSGRNELVTEFFQTGLSQVNKGIKGEGGINDALRFVEPKELLEASLAGYSMGVALPFASNIRSNTSDAKNLALNYVREFNFKKPSANIVRTEKFFAELQNKIKQKYSDADGNIIATKEYNDEISALSDIRNAGLKMPINFSKVQRQEATDLILERSKLQRENEGIDPQFQAKNKARINQINKRLNDLAEVEIQTRGVEDVTAQLDDDIVDSFLTFDTSKELEEWLEGKGVENAEQKSQQRGLSLNIDGVEYSIQNNEKNSKSGFFSGMHETLHKFLKNTLKTNPDVVFPVAKILKKRLIELENDPRVNSQDLKLLNNTLQKYKDDVEVDSAIEAEEVITLFSEFANKGIIPFDTQKFQGVRDATRRLLQNLPGAKNLKFENELDVFNFIKDYNRSIRKGRFTRAQVRAAREGIDIGEDIQQVADADEAARKPSNRDLKQAKDIAIDEIIENKNTNDPSVQMELAYQFYPDVVNYIKSGRFKIGNERVIDNPKIAGVIDEDGFRREGAVTIEDLAMDIVTSDRGVKGIVADYFKKPASERGTLGQFVGGGKFDLYRATEIAANTLGMQSQEIKQETTEDFSKEEKPSLRKTMTDLAQELNFDEQSTEEAAIEQAEVESLASDMAEAASKILKGKLKAPTSKEFIQDLQKQSSDLAFKRVKELMGKPKSEQYTKFIEDYALAILNKTAQTTLNKRFNKLTQPVIDPETGKQARTLTEESRAEGSRIKNPYAGNPKRELIPDLDVQDMVEYFTPEKGRRDAKQNTLAEVAAFEFVVDAMPEALKTKLDDGTTIAERRADLFGQDVVNAEIAYIARELGRGVDYKAAKNIVLPADLAEEFETVAPEIVEAAQKFGIGIDEDYTEGFAQAIEGVDPRITEALVDVMFTESPELAEGGEFIKEVVGVLEELNPDLAAAIKRREFVTASKKQGVRVINERPAKNLNKLAQRITSSLLDNRLVKAFNPTLEFVGYANRLLNAAKETGPNKVNAPFYADRLRAQGSNYIDNSQLKDIIPAHIKPMNKSFGFMAKTLKNIFSTTSLESKLAMVEKERNVIELANIANKKVISKLILAMQKDLASGKGITKSQVYQFFQLQTGVVKGLRALTSLDYLYLIEGNQWIEGKARPKILSFLELTEEAQQAKIQEFIDEFPEFKDRYDIRLEEKLNAVDSKTGEKKYTFEEARARAAFDPTLSAYRDLKTKGEHLVPNSVTMIELAEGVLRNNLDQAKLDQILAGHGQFFGPNYVMDLLDTKGIEGGKKIALTSKEGIFRLSKFLKNTPSVSNNIYALNGNKAFNEILNTEIFFKASEDLDNSIKEAKDFDVDMLKALDVVEFSEAPSMNQVLEKAKIIDDALKVARNPLAPIKKIRVFDFDDTLATSNNIVIATSPDGTTIELNAEEFAEKGQDLKNQGYKMDFSDFNRVTDGGRGPLFEVAEKIRNARGNEDLFVLTARAPEAQGAIYDFLKSQGLEFKRQNIIGLGNSTGEAKANWIISKAAEGYNDFYFADDAMQNVNAVRKALDVIDVKSQVQQAKIKFAKDVDVDFNKIIQQKTGIAAEKEFSDAKAQVRGANKGNYKFFIPYSAEDFQGLLYPLLSKGSLGDAQMAWFKTHLMDPYARAMENLSQDRLNLMEDFKELKRRLDVPKNLRQENESGFSNEQAVRVYLWNQQGVDMQDFGLSKTDQRDLVKQVETDLTLKEFADQLVEINKASYPTPDKSWLAGSITSDLLRGLKEVKRPKYLKEWQDNVDLIFSKKNLNKLEAAYGPKYREAMENILKRMKSGSNRVGESSRLGGKILNYINGSNAAIMFFNTRSAILQTISSINFLNWNFNNPLKAGQAFANQPQYWKDFMTLMNSDFLKDRRNGLRINITESEIADAAKTSKNKAKAALAYILSKGYLPTQYADSFAIASGGATFYRNRIKDLVKNQSMSEADAEKQALREFREISEENQQSSRPDKISQQQASDAGRLILMFANTPMQYARLQKRAFQDLVNGRGDSKTNVSKLIYYGVVQNIIFNSLQQAMFAIGFGDEDEEKDEKRVTRTLNGMLDSLLRGLGIAGATTSIVKNFLADVYERSGRSRPEYVDSVYELLRISPPISSKISRIRQAAYMFDSKKRREEIMDMGFSIKNPAFMAFAKVVSATANIPLDRVLQKFDNIEGALSEDAETWQRIAMLAGWPKWDIQPDGKSEDKKKNKKRKIRKQRR